MFLIDVISFMKSFLILRKCEFDQIKMSIRISCLPPPSYGEKRIKLLGMKIKLGRREGGRRKKGSGREAGK